MPTPFCAEDLRLYRAVSSLDCAHDDGLGVCAVHSIDAGSGDPLTNLWLVPTDGTAPQQFTQGDADDARDGRQTVRVSRSWRRVARAGRCT
ncbi:hypothetical protein [Achromobacter animicus]|uniref:hypothetical protein n=1 Tax=Achromobacter animicus TaxID=1389935 RepID=UPI00345E0CB3